MKDAFMNMLKVQNWINRGCQINKICDMFHEQFHIINEAMTFKELSSILAQSH